MRRDVQGVLLAVVAALLFGLVSVAAKLTDVHALVKGGLAYLFAGIALSITLRRMRVAPRDWPKILAMSLVGGALAPALLFLGLDRVTVATASILLTLEMLFTALLAALFLGERARGRALLGVTLLFLAAVLASLPTADAGATTLVGAWLVAAAALGWGVDNTISAKLVGTYRPHQLVAIKGLVGGGAALIVAILLGASLRMSTPDLGRIALIGLVGVGASIVLFYQSLGRIGATRASAIFLPSVALAGVASGWLLLGEGLAWTHGVAAAVATIGVLLGLRRGEGGPAGRG